MGKWKMGSTSWNCRHSVLNIMGYCIFKQISTSSLKTWACAQKQNAFALVVAIFIKYDLRMHPRTRSHPTWKAHQCQQICLLCSLQDRGAEADNWMKGFPCGDEERDSITYGPVLGPLSHSWVKFFYFFMNVSSWGDRERKKTGAPVQ